MLNNVDFVYCTAMPYDIESYIRLDILYSIEQEKIPVLTELMKNQNVRSVVCSESAEGTYKWPTFTKMSRHEPTWDKLLTILKLANLNDLVKNLQLYLKKMKGKIDASYSHKICVWTVLVIHMCSLF